MVMQIVDLSTSTAVNLGTTDDAFVAAGVVLDVAGNAINAAGSNHNIVVAGQVSSTVWAINLGDSDSLDSGNSVEVLAGASVYGNVMSLVMWGPNSTVTNRGTLAAGSWAIDIVNSVTSATNTITNSGLIVSNVAILNQAFGNAPLGQLNIYNSGTILGFSQSLVSDSAGIERVYNKGRMEGNIEFDGGNDLYDGRGGTFKGTAFGEAGGDTFIGGNGVERFNGGIGADKFTGGLGKDVLTMGTGVGDGIDKIIFNAVTEVGDIVTDFSTADFFQFKKSAFGNLALGTLSSAAYWENTTGAAHDASDRFIFETDLSRLWYDKDGTGSAAKVLVVDMSNTVNISNSDIQII